MSHFSAAREVERSSCLVCCRPQAHVLTTAPDAKRHTCLLSRQVEVLQRKQREHTGLVPARRLGSIKRDVKPAFGPPSQLPRMGPTPRSCLMSSMLQERLCKEPRVQATVRQFALDPRPAPPAPGEASPACSRRRNPPGTPPWAAGLNVRALLAAAPPCSAYPEEMPLTGWLADAATGGPGCRAPASHGSAQ